MTVLHHVALAFAAAALGGAGLRLAAATGARGLELIVAASPFAAVFAVAWALGLGLVDLGGSTVALAAGAALTWLAARTLLPEPDPTPRRQLAAWWAQTPLVFRACVAATCAGAVGLVAWQLRHPYVSLDGLTYHLALPQAWIHEGSPGGIVELLGGVPVANYPVTHEVLLGWAMALSHSWVVASVITPAMLALLTVAVWTGLRSLDVPRIVAALAAAALVTLPLNAYQYGGPLTDLPATAWLAVAAALVALSLRGPRPLLLAPALVAGGMAFGTKTTPGLMLALVLGFGFWRHRRALPALKAPLGGALALALVACAVWPLRNAITHGSPAWPFAPGPFGDPVPDTFAPFRDSFLSRPREMLSDGRLSAYAIRLAGALVLLPAAVVLPLVRRSKPALAAAAATVLAAFAWMAAPYTAILTSTELAVGSTRYLLPGLLAATVAIALSARHASRVLQGTVVAVLGFSVLLSVARSLALKFPFVPSPKTLVAAGVLGAVAALLAGRRRLPVGRWIAPAAVLACGLALAAAAPGYVNRHGTTFGVLVKGYPELLRGLQTQPGYKDNARPVAIGVGVFALLGGDRLRHPVVLIPSTERCAGVRARTRQGWVIVGRAAIPESRRLQACMASVTRTAVYGPFDLYGPR